MSLSWKRRVGMTVEYAGSIERKAPYSSRQKPNRAMRDFGSTSSSIVITSPWSLGGTLSAESPLKSQRDFGDEIIIALIKLARQNSVEAKIIQAVRHRIAALDFVKRCYVIPRGDHYQLFYVIPEASDEQLDRLYDQEWLLMDEFPDLLFDFGLSKTDVEVGRDIDSSAIACG
jgi:hypothetical protein